MRLRDKLSLHYLGCRLFGWHGIAIYYGWAYCRWCPWEERLPEVPA